MEAFILSAVEQGVMTITLNRPDRLNSFNDLMHHQLAECLKQAERDDGVRCLLITGAGRGFCAGQDLNDRNVDPSGPPPDLGMSVERFYNPLVRRLAALPKPVICAVNGVAAGAGALFLWQESAIKHKTPLDGFRKDLPALGALDKVNAMATLVGFPCYTLGVLSGLLWARISWGSFMSGDFKEWISLVILALYALLFHQRQALGWRGRKPAILALVIFAASLFSMFVVNTVLSTQHGF